MKKYLYKSHRITLPCLIILLTSFLYSCGSFIRTTPILRGTGDLGLVIERAAGRVLVVDTTHLNVLNRIKGLGNLSHASIVYSRDARFGYVFGRDGGLSKVDLLEGRLVKRIVQAGNSIGGAISQDGKLIAVSNYDPGGVKIFDATDLKLIADIPAIYNEQGKRSKVVGLVDAPGQNFVFSLWDANQIWTVDMSNISKPDITKYYNVGKAPYDGLITPDGRYYIAGLFGEDGLALLDLWKPKLGVKRILDNYGRGEKKLPVYKMPHLEGWAVAGNIIFLPAVGRHEVLMLDYPGWNEIGRINVAGQPIFAIARPDGRQIWVNFALPNNNLVQIIDVQDRRVIKTLKPGKAILHMEFTPRAEHVWLSVRDENRVDIYDTATFKKKTAIFAEKPSGIFFTSRAHKIGL